MLAVAPPHCQPEQLCSARMINCIYNAVNELAAAARQNAGKIQKMPPLSQSGQGITTRISRRLEMRAN
jgi:hypothetical protein